MSDITQRKSADNKQVIEPSESVDDTQLTLLEIFGSAISAMIGVQSKERRARDFTRGKASHFIIVGAVVTALFVLAMAAAVSLVLSFLT